MVSIKAPLFSCPCRSEPSFMIGKLLFFPLCEDDTLEKIATQFFILFITHSGAAGPFATLTCERAFSRHHQFDVYCIKRGRAWPQENIKASSISLEKKKKTRWTKIHYTARRQRMGKSRFFFQPSGYRSASLKGNHPRSISFDFIIFFIADDGDRWWSGGFSGGKKMWSLEECV